MYRLNESILFCVILGVALVLSCTNNATTFHPATAKANPPAESPTDATTHQSIEVANNEKTAHSSSLLDLGDRLMLVYFAGSKEGASDVKIMSHFIDKQTLDYTPQREILSAKSLSLMADKFIKKLGNPVIFKDEMGGGINLFVVGVSLGGWATSRIYQLKFSSDLSQLEFRGELQLGLLANFSHLVRTPAILLENGGFMLPLYHELARKYPLVAFFDNDANLTHTRRLTTLKNQLQPTIIALNKSECLAFFRNHKAYQNASFLQKCKDGGESWDAPQPTNLKAYDDSYLLLSYINAENKRRILLLYNDGKGTQNGVTYNNSRRRLSLYFLQDSTLDFKRDSSEVQDSANLRDSTKLKDSANSQDSAPNSNQKLDSSETHKNHHFTFLLNIDTVDESYPNEVSYPSAIIADSTSGNLHATAQATSRQYLFIAYTHNRKRIKVQKIDLQDLEQRIKMLENSDSNEAQKSFKTPTLARGL